MGAEMIEFHHPMLKAPDTSDIVQATIDRLESQNEDLRRRLAVSHECSQQAAADFNRRLAEHNRKTFAQMSVLCQIRDIMIENGELPFSLPDDDS